MTLKEFIKWLESEDRQNWEIERCVGDMLIDQQGEDRCECNKLLIAKDKFMIQKTLTKK